MATFPIPPTWQQFLDAKTAEIVAEHGCTAAEARECAPNHAAEWRTMVEVWIEQGGVPTQAWVNAVQTRDQHGNHVYGWWEQFLKHRPDVFDHLFREGLSTHMTKRELHAPQEA